MNSMQEAMVKAGLVSKNHAERLEKDKEILKLNTEKSARDRQVRELHKKLKSVVKNASTTPKEDVFKNIAALSEQYPRDVFDQCTTELRFSLTLPHLNIHLPS